VLFPTQFTRTKPAGLSCCFRARAERTHTSSSISTDGVSCFLAQVNLRGMGFVAAANLRSPQLTEVRPRP
jgi:hypothetical protein